MQVGNTYGRLVSAYDFEDFNGSDQLLVLRRQMGDFAYDGHAGEHTAESCVTGRGGRSVQLGLIAVAEEELRGRGVWIGTSRHGDRAVFIEDAGGRGGFQWELGISGLFAIMIAALNHKARDGTEEGAAVVKVRVHVVQKARGSFGGMLFIEGDEDLALGGHDFDAYAGGCRMGSLWKNRGCAARKNCES